VRCSFGRALLVSVLEDVPAEAEVAVGVVHELRVDAVEGFDLFGGDPHSLGLPLEVAPLEVVDGGCGPGAGAVGGEFQRLGQGCVVQEPVYALAVVPGSGQVWDLGEDLGQEHRVVSGEVVGPVVDDDDAGRRVVIDIDPGDGDLLPAELPGGRVGVVARQDLVAAAGVRALVDDDRTVLAVGRQRLGDGGEVAVAGVPVVRRQVPDGDGERQEQIGDVGGRRSHWASLV
jgi:hypothetical protein